MATTLYMLPGVAPSILKPSGYKSAWTVNIAANAGAGAKSLGLTSGSSQISSGASANVASGQSVGCAQFCSDALAAQSIAAASFTVGYAIQAGVASSFTGTVSILLMTSAGTTRSNIASVNTVNATADTGATEVTTWTSSTLLNASVTAFAGDYLLVEIGATCAGATTTLTTFAGGATAITSTNTATADAQAFITYSGTLLFQGQNTTFYPRLSEPFPPSILNRPAGYLGVWGSSIAANAGAGAFYADFIPGTSQVTSSGQGVATSANGGIAQFLTQPLAAQTVAAGNWMIGFATTASASVTYSGKLAILLVNGSTGAVRTTVFATGTVGSSTTTGVEITHFTQLIAGGAFTSVDGDYLAFEIGIVNSGTTGTSFTLSCDGNTLIITNNTGASDARSHIVAPALLIFQSTFPAGSGYPTNLLNNPVYRM